MRALMNRIRDAGGLVELVGTDVLVRVKAGVLTDGDRSILRGCKPALVRLLEAERHAENRDALSEPLPVVRLMLREAQRFHEPERGWFVLPNGTEGRLVLDGDLASAANLRTDVDELSAVEDCLRWQRRLGRDVVAVVLAGRVRVVERSVIAIV
jgi:hypothetical protein